MSDFDAMLWRPIKPGKEFDSLMPKSKCQTTYLGDGLTDFSINKMEQWVLDHATQTEQLAKVLKKQSLKSTCETIHSFLFNHFQYKADDSDQMLRSPACSWYTRKEGIDCKSYSIFASCLLLNMGITHYIRKIKQPGYAPDEFTHVYVIVPIDQTNGTLKKGYYTIDGTIPNMIEPALIGKSDLKMSGNRHYGLNAPSSLKGLNGVSIDKLKGLSKQISLKNIGSIWNAIKCGSSAFTQNMSEVSLGKIDEYYANWQLKFNTAIQNKDFVNVSKLVAEYLSNSFVFKAASTSKAGQGFNACTTARINANTRAFTFYSDVVGKILTAYLDEYFNKTSGTQSFTAFSEGSEALYGFHFTNSKVEFVKTIPYSNLQPKNVNIPAFFIPKMVEEKANSGAPLDLNQVLGLLETAANVLIPSTIPNDPNSGGSYIQDLNDDGTPKAKTMGAGAVVGTIVVLGGLTYVLTQGKNKN